MKMENHTLNLDEYHKLGPDPAAVMSHQFYLKSRAERDARQGNAMVTTPYRFDQNVFGCDDMADTWVFGPGDAETIAAMRQFFPELNEWSDAHLLAAWGSYSQDILAVNFADVRDRDTGLLAYLYVRQEVPHFEFGGTGLYNTDIWDLGETAPWLTHAPCGAPFNSPERN